MKFLVIGAHLRREDVEPLADALRVGSVPTEPRGTRGTGEPGNGDLFLSALTIPDDQPLGDRDLLLRVADLRAQLLERATFIAIRYGFAPHDANEAAAKCAPHLARWRALLEAHRHDVEMTLKVVAADAKPRPDRRDFASGADYLHALHDATNAADVDPRFRGAASRIAERHRWIHRDGRSLECAMLVARTDVPRVRDAGQRLKSDFPEVPFLLSGPWPLEVYADHE